MGEWKEYRLGDILTIRSGISYKGKFIGRGNSLLLGMGCVSYSDRFIMSGARPYSGPFEKRYKVYPGDIVLATRQQSDNLPILAMPAMVPKTLEGKDLVIGTNLYKVEITDKSFSNEYIYWLMKTRRYVNYIKGVKTGTTVSMVTKKNVEDFTFFAPTDPRERESLVSIISSLDSKIENNRKICANLEAQAQALFKHWFIDFAPFKDGKFVESELGMIPEGWRVGTYSDIIKDTISGDWGKDSSVGNYNHKVACIRGCDFQDVKMGLRGKTPERFILEKNFQSKHFENKDVLVEISGGTATVSTGRVCPVSQLLIDRYNGDVVCTNFCKLVRPIDGYSSYLYYSWKYKYDRKVMFGYENGTSGIKNFSIKDFTTREPLVLPTLTAINEFEGIIEHIHTQIQNCGSESSKLAVIRDTLLPKLMSGELQVNDTETT